MLLPLCALITASCVGLGDADGPVDKSMIDMPVIAPVPLPAEPIVGAVQPEVSVVKPAAVGASDDLAYLATQLGVPVQGIAASQLRDSYTEMRGERVHEAIDILAERGTPVLAATSGRLLKIFSSKPGGLMLYTTDATEQFIMLYGHLDSYAPGLINGMQLTRGQVIGYVGTTGNAPPGTPHLHFGILRGDPRVSWSKGSAVNPYTLLTLRSTN